MDSRNAAFGGGCGALAALPQYPLALLTLPDLERPPAIMEMWELEGVAAALPAKKRRLREIFDRLDLDTRRQLREHERSRPAPLAPALALPAISAPPAAGGDVFQERILEKSRALPAHDPTPPAVCELPSAGGDAHMLRALENYSEPVQAPALTLATVSAPAGTKRKASSQEAEEVHVATRFQEGLADMGKIHGHEDAAVRKKASPLQDDVSGNGKKVRPVPPGDDNVLAAEANASTETTAQQEIAGPEPAAARHAPNSPKSAEASVPKFTCLHLQRKRPPRPVPASAAVSAAPALTGSDLERSNKRKLPSQEPEASMKLDDAVETMPQVERHDLAAAKNTSHNGRKAKVTPLRPGHVNADPISKVVVGGVDSFSLAKLPQLEHRSEEEVPQVKMEVVEPEETQFLEKDAPPVADEKASPLKQVSARAAADKVSRRLSPGCRSGLAQAGARAATTVPVDTAGVAAVTRDAPNLVQAGALKSAGVPAAKRDDPDATLLAPAGSQDASNASAVPPRRGSGEDCAAATRRGLNASNLVPDSRRRREATGGPSQSQGKAYLNASNNHVLLQQHMSKKGCYREPISPAQKHKARNRDNNHGGGSRPVPEAQDAAAAQGPCNKSGDSGHKKHNGRGQPALFCTRCGCRGHLAEDCRTKFCSKCGYRGHLAEDCRTKFCSKCGYRGHLAEDCRAKFCSRCGSRGHLAETCRAAEHEVVLYKKAKNKKQICYRCGCRGHWSRTCRTEKHLVDLYQKDIAAKRAASATGLAPEASRMNTTK
ncbi:hypothetical protein BS78_01G163000 [Paspalum vaginatum]|nr:hypothetical protein BS78_01G163000 [Paspalum vaginatum]